MPTPAECELLLHAHMVCAGDLLHVQAHDQLTKKVKRTRISSKSRAELDKILELDPKRIRPRSLLKQIRKDRRRTVYTSLLRYSAVDGYLDPDERQLLTAVAAAWKIPSDQVTQKLAAIDAKLAEARADAAKKRPRFIARMLGKLSGHRKAPSHAVVTTDAADPSPLEAFLGERYDEVLEECVRRAAEDFPFTHELLDASVRAMEKLQQELGGVVSTLRDEAKPKGATTARAIHESAAATHASLRKKLGQYRNGLNASLAKKKRSIDRVTIAVLGRTRAGKSTFHAVLTRSGRGGIGLGSQRTTRTNRTYEWERLRIIDTPGFGAAVGGEETAKRDAAIARGILPEADLVCFLVTNDSQQQSDFEVLAAVRALAKPLIVILNFKSSLDDPDLREHALSDPNGLMPAREVAEHEGRIREYARAAYGSDDFDIVPVHLYAALEGVEGKSEHAAALTEKSGIPTLLDRMRVAIIEEGPIRRTQTLLGMLQGELEPAHRWAATHAKQFAASARTLAAQGNAGLKQLEEAARDAQEELKEEIAAVTLALLEAVPTFAERNWKESRQSINAAWEATVKRLAPESRIKRAARRVEERYVANVREIVENTSDELRLLASLQGFSTLLAEQDSSTFGRKLMGLVVIALRIGGVIALFVTGSPVWLWLASAAEQLRTFFMTEDKKRRRAVGNITQHLRKDIEEYEKTTQKELREKLRDVAAGVEKRYTEYFARLSGIAHTIHRHIAHAERALVRLGDEATTLYAKRIVDLARGKPEPLTQKAVAAVIAAVERDFGVSLRIVLKKRSAFTVPAATLSRMLQERISFQSPSKKRR